MEKRSYSSYFDWPDPAGFTPQMSNYIYKDEVEKVIKLIKSNVTKNKNRQHSVNKYKKNEKQKGITVAVTAERGNGKTTFLNVLSDKISEENKDVKLKVLPIINPSLFAGKLNILESIISSISKDLNNLDRSVECFEVFDLINKISNSIINVRVDSDYFSKNTSTEDYIETSAQLLDISSNLSMLVKEYLKQISDPCDCYDGLVVMIDDLDLVDKTNISSIWNELQNILANTPINFVLTYRDSQIRHAIYYSLYSENEKLIKAEVFNSEELVNQVSSIVNKQIPANQIIVLDDISQFMNRKITDVLKSIILQSGTDENNCDTVEELFRKLMMFGHNDITRLIKPENSVGKDHLDFDIDKMTAKEWVSTFIRINLGIKMDPVSSFEKIEGEFPRSIREFIEYFKILVEMADQFLDSNVSLLRINLINLNKLRDYLLNMSNNYLPQAYSKVLNDFVDAIPSRKNYIIYSFLYKLEQEIRATLPVDQLRLGAFKEKDFEGLRLQIDGVNSKNTLEAPIPELATNQTSIAIGDIVLLIKIIEAQLLPNENFALFINNFKRLYSIILRMELIGCKILDSGNNLSCLDNYMLMTNHLLMPHNYNYLRLPFDEFKSGMILQLDGSHDWQTNFLSDLVYSDTSMTSRYTRRYTPNKSSETVNDDITRLFQFSNDNYFEHLNEDGKDEEINMGKDLILKGHQKYHFDLYSWIISRSYVNKALNKTNYYLFFNLFDLDEFVQNNYSRETTTLVEKFGTALFNVMKMIDTVQNFSDNLFYPDIIDMDLPDRDRISSINNIFQKKTPNLYYFPWESGNYLSVITLASAYAKGVGITSFETSEDLKRRIKFINEHFHEIDKLDIVKLSNNQDFSPEENEIIEFRKKLGLLWWLIFELDFSKEDTTNLRSTRYSEIEEFKNGKSDNLKETIEQYEDLKKTFDDESSTFRPINILTPEQVNKNLLKILDKLSTNPLPENDKAKKLADSFVDLVEQNIDNANLRRLTTYNSFKDIESFITNRAAIDNKTRQSHINKLKNHIKNFH